MSQPHAHKLLFASLRAQKKNTRTILLKKLVIINAQNYSPRKAIFDLNLSELIAVVLILRFLQEGIHRLILPFTLCTAPAAATAGCAELGGVGCCGGIAGDKLLHIEFALTALCDCALREKYYLIIFIEK